LVSGPQTKGSRSEVPTPRLSAPRNWGQFDWAAALKPKPTAITAKNWRAIPIPHAPAVVFIALG
jgi:hypothetical protein